MKITECDGPNCHQVNSENPMGWFTLLKNFSAGSIGTGRTKFDFCSAKCLGEFAIKAAEKGLVNV